MIMKKCIIFDLDGTLLNTIDDICDSLNAALRDNLLSEIDVEKCKYMVGSGVDVLIQRAVPDLLKQESVKKAYMAYYEKNQKNRTQPYPHIMDLLSRLKTTSIRLAVLSNKPDIDTKRVADYYFPGIFDIVMGKKEYNLPKPAIDGCLEIMNQLQIFDSILYVGDTNVDMQTAKNAGYQAVAVSWGFRKKEELEQYDYMIDDPLSLLFLLGE
jgi:phosphoglycolate phosphatase